MRREISYKTYCLLGALRNPHMSKSYYPNGKARYWWIGSGPCYYATRSITEKEMKI